MAVSKEMKKSKKNKKTFTKKNNCLLDNNCLFNLKVFTKIMYMIKREFTTQCEVFT